MKKENRKLFLFKISVIQRTLPYLGKFHFEEEHFRHVPHGVDWIGSKELAGVEHEAEVRCPVLMVAATEVVIASWQTEVGLVELREKKAPFYQMCPGI